MNVTVTLAAIGVASSIPLLGWTLFGNEERRARLDDLVRRQGRLVRATGLDGEEIEGLPSMDPTAGEHSSTVQDLAKKLSTAAERVVEHRDKKRVLNTSLEQAGIDLRAGEFLVIVAALVVPAFLLGMAMMGGPLFGLIFAGAAVMLSRMVVSRRVKKRQTQFTSQLGDTLSLISSSMRAGQGLMQAIDSVARQAEAPTSEEFRRVVIETRLGRDLIVSLHAMADRMNCDDLAWVIPAIEINRDIGGDLAGVLDNVGQTIRDRADIRRQVKTLSAEGRMSAYVLVGMPLVILAVVRVTNPTYLNELTYGTGLKMGITGAILMLMGTGWLMKMCKIDF